MAGNPAASGTQELRTLPGDLLRVKVPPDTTAATAHSASSLAPKEKGRRKWKIAFV